MLTRILQAVLVACVVGLICILGGLVLNSIGVPPAEAVGGFLTRWAWAIGVIAGLWYFLSGGAFPSFGPKA